jgi:hypothetical protein
VKTQIFVEVLSVKTIPSCGDLFHRHSRVPSFKDIIVFGLRMYKFYFSCVFCEFFKYNVIAFMLHLRGVLKIHE